MPSAPNCRVTVAPSSAGAPFSDVRTQAVPARSKLGAGATVGSIAMGASMAIVGSGATVGSGTGVAAGWQAASSSTRTSRRLILTRVFIVVVFLSCVGGTECSKRDGQSWTQELPVRCSSPSCFKWARVSLVKPAAGAAAAWAASCAACCSASACCRATVACACLAAAFCCCELDTAPDTAVAAPTTTAVRVAVSIRLGRLDREFHMVTFLSVTDDLCSVWWECSPERDPQGAPNREPFQLRPAASSSVWRVACTTSCGTRTLSQQSQVNSATTESQPLLRWKNGVLYCPA